MYVILDKLKLCISFILFVLLLSCGRSDSVGSITVLQNLPRDTGGSHTAQLQSNTQAVYGYYEYLPGGYDNTAVQYPLLVFLHGAGEKGNSNTNSVELDRVLLHGPPKLIENGVWSPDSPMLVISPQTADDGWNPDTLHAFLDYLIANYKVNTRRIYLTGLSMGGFGAFNYVGTKAADSHVAAIVPICGGGNTNHAGNYDNTPVWAFHGAADAVVDLGLSINMVNAINDSSPNTRAALTVYPGVGHDSWTRTYSQQGMGSESEEYDPFDQSICDWFLSIEKK